MIGIILVQDRANETEGAMSRAFPKTIVILIVALAFVYVSTVMVLVNQSCGAFNTRSLTFQPHDFIYQWVTYIGPGNSNGKVLKFVPDGTFTCAGRFYANEETLMYISGLWEVIHGDTLRLTVTQRKDSIDKQIITTDLNPPMISEYFYEFMAPTYRIRDDGSLRLTSIRIDDVVYLRVFEYTFDDPRFHED